MDASRFPERLKELREQAGLTQQALADRVGVGQNTIARWETGLREPSWASVLQLCEALGVSCEDFIKPPKKSK